MPSKPYREQPEIVEAESVYEKVKARLDEARIKGLEEERRKADAGEPHQYGHDLFQALRMAEFQERQEVAAHFLTEHCDGNLFAAFSRIVRAALDGPENELYGGEKESQEDYVRRALESELRGLPREAERARKRRLA